jgi:hypothetical protein
MMWVYGGIWVVGLGWQKRRGSAALHIGWREGSLGEGGCGREVMGGRQVRMGTVGPVHHSLTVLWLALTVFGGVRKMK